MPLQLNVYLCHRKMLLVSWNSEFIFVFTVGSKDGSIGPGGFGRSDGEGDDRLAHILSEASHMMKTPSGAPINDDSRSNEDSSSPRTQCLSPFSKVSTVVFRSGVT